MSRSKIKVQSRNFKRSKGTVLSRNFLRSIITLLNHHFGQSKITLLNRNFGQSKITLLNDNFWRCKITAHNRNFGLPNWTLIQIYGYMLSFWRYIFIILDPSKWTAPHRRNWLCPNVHMWVVQLDEDPKLRSTTVILDRPILRLYNVILDVQIMQFGP